MFYYLSIIFIFCLAAGISVAFYPNSGYLIAGLFLIIEGILSQFRATLEWMIKLKNKLHGKETNITEFTIKYWRILGRVFMAIGLIAVFVFFKNMF